MRRLDANDTERLRKHKDRAVELSSKGKLEGAIAEHLAALAIAPWDIVSRQRVAELLARLGRKTEAIDHYLCLVGKFATEGFLLKAIATCHLILQLDPFHAATLATLADLYAERDAPKPPVRMPSSMSGALKERPSAPPPEIDRERLARVPLFSDLAPDAFVSLLRELVRSEARAGDVIVEEGDAGDALYAVASGVVRVERPNALREPRVFAELKEGAFFGEMSLVARCPRLATVTAVSDCELLVLGREELARVIQAHPHVGEVMTRFYKERLLANVLRASPLLRKLPVEKRRCIPALFDLRAYPPGKTLLLQGQPSAGFFLLLRGECDAFVRTHQGIEEHTSRMREGDVFGEVSLLQNGPVTASVRTRTTCVVLHLDRKGFEELLLVHPPIRESLEHLASQRLERSREVFAKELFDEDLV